MGSLVGPAPVQVTAESSSRTHSLRHTFEKSVQNSLRDSFVKTVQMSGLEDLGPLPEGWSLKWHGVGNTRRPYFINHHTKQTTWEDPRKQSYNITPSQSRGTPIQSKPKVPARATLSDEEIMAKAIALSKAEEEQRKKKALNSQPKPTPQSQSNRPTIKTSSNDDDDWSHHSNDNSPVIAASDFSSFAFDANPSSSAAGADASTKAKGPASQTQNEARRAVGPNPALRKGPNPDLLLSERAEAKGPDPSLCQGPMGLAKGPQARPGILAA